MSNPLEHVDAISALAREHGFTVGAAESLTGGAVASALARGQGAADWFHGAVIAYSRAVKQGLLGVTAEQLVTDQCGIEMVRGAVKALDVDVAVSTTGAGGPGPEEGQPAGTVFVGLSVHGQESCHRLELAGDPGEVVEAATQQALGLMLSAMQDAVGRRQT